MLFRSLVTALGAAVEAGHIANETLGYFIGRTYLFLLRAGCKAEHIRFRQAYHQCCGFFTLAWKIKKKWCEDADVNETDFHQRFERFNKPLWDLYYYNWSLDLTTGRPHNESSAHTHFFMDKFARRYRRLVGPSVTQIFPHSSSAGDATRLWFRILIY